MHGRASLRTPSWIRQRRRALVAVLAASVLLVATVVGTLARGAPGFDHHAATERLDQVLVLVEEMRAAIDRSAFDVEALAGALTSLDGAGMAAWVEREIAFEPYPGLLRGASGSLVARAGNALDQAVLLGALLEHAGYETRVAFGMLDDEQVEALLQRALLPRPAWPALGDLDRLAGALTGFAELLDVPDAHLQHELALAAAPSRAHVDDDTLLSAVAGREEALLVALREAGVELGEDTASALRSEARQYAWIEARRSPDAAWAAYHPTGFEPDAALVASRHVELGAIPSEYRHRFRFEAWIERRDGDQVERLPVMEPWEAPVAALLGEVLEYGNVPEGFTTSSLNAFDLDRVLADASAFVPRFRAQVPAGAVAFTLAGTTAAPAASGAAAASPGALMDRVAGAFGGIGRDPEPDVETTELTGHGFDLVLIAPGGHETRYRRWLLEPAAGSDGRTTGAGIDERLVRRALVRQERIALVSGALAPGFVLDMALERIVASRALLTYALAQVADPDPDAALPADAVPAAAPLGHLLLTSLFDQPLALAGDAVGFRAGPTILALGQGISAEDRLRYAVDIVSNDRRVLVAGEHGGVRIDPVAALRRGVWETLAEREALAEPEGLRGGPGVELFASADLQGPLTVVRPGDDVSAAALGMSAIAEAQILADLDRGFVVLLGSVDDRHVQGWWRVDPVTGTALGVSVDGRGQMLAEYYLKTYDAVFTVMFALKGFYDCRGLGGIAEACCLVKAHVNNLLGVGFGGAVGGVAGSSAALAFTILTGAFGADYIGGGGLGLVCPKP